MTTKRQTTRVPQQRAVPVYVSIDDAAKIMRLFPAAGDPTKHLATATLYKVFYKARDEAGRPDLRFHDLRHTGAVLAARVESRDVVYDGPGLSVAS